MRAVRLLAPAIATVLLIACTAFATDAGATSLKRTIPRPEKVAVDGTDIYWLKHIDRRTTQLALMRTSFLDRKKVRLATFSFTGRYEPISIGAGGGHVFVYAISDGMDFKADSGVRSKIVRISRDGLTRTVIASGLDAATEEEGVVIDEDAVGRLNDCGKQVSLMSVTAAGSAVIREVTAERDSGACGGKPNVNHSRIYEFPLVGAPREIFKFDNAYDGQVKIFDGGYEWGGRVLGPWVERAEVYGDRAVFSYGRSGGLFVRDLSTGSTTGPYLAGLPAKSAFAVGSLDPAGRLAINRVTIVKGTRFDSDKAASGLYGTPGDINLFQKVSSTQTLSFCGRHLIAFGRKRAVELDPMTLAPVRTISSNGTAFDLTDLHCTDEYVYGVRANRKSQYTYFATPLNGD